jgi:hypothetical protein
MVHRFLKCRYQAKAPIENWLQAILKEQEQRIAGAEPTETCTRKAVECAFLLNLTAKPSSFRITHRLNTVYKHLAWKRALYT